MTHLSETALTALPPSVVRPSYDRSKHKAGIVHLGIGAFHRAHQAVFTDDVLSTTGGDWMITGASLRSTGLRDRLRSQDWLYSVVERDDACSRARVIGSIDQILCLSDQAPALIRSLVSPATKIVSLTITEKGYCSTPGMSRLDAEHADIVHDLTHPDTPVSAIGLITLALKTRRDRGIEPFTPLSCDNLPENGRLLRQLTLEYAALTDDSLSSWIAANVPFPSSMVDRIVPAQTVVSLELCQAELGLKDEAGLVTEPFSQWIIEDSFASTRPAWDEAGAVFCSDVADYERMKLRLLNGAHSALAYLGVLSGKETVSDCMKDRSLAAFIEEMMRLEISPTLAPPPGQDLGVYISDLLHRFRNSSLHHRCAQIAMDGSQKVPQRLLRTIEDRLRAGQPVSRLTTAVAGWLLYSRGRDLTGTRISVSDPLAEDLSRIGRDTSDARTFVDAHIDANPAFSSFLRKNPVFREALNSACETMIRNGVLASLPLGARHS